MYAYLVLKYEHISVSVLFDGETQQEIFHKLRKRRDEIEAEIGAKLVWTHAPNQSMCEIVLRNPVDPTEEALWPTYFDWMKEIAGDLSKSHRPVGSADVTARQGSRLRWNDSDACTLS